MAPVSAKLVTIIMISEDEDTIVKAFRSLGVSGYTMFRARGFGAHGEQSGGFLGGENVVLQTVASAAVAARILEWVEVLLQRGSADSPTRATLRLFPGSTFTSTRILGSLPQTPPGGHLTVSGKQAETGIEVAVSDTGVGTKPRGLGLGLARPGHPRQAPGWRSCSV